MMFGPTANFALAMAGLYVVLYALTRVRGKRPRSPVRVPPAPRQGDDQYDQDEQEQQWADEYPAEQNSYQQNGQQQQ